MNQDMACWSGWERTGSRGLLVPADVLPAVPETAPVAEPAPVASTSAPVEAPVTADLADTFAPDRVDTMAVHLGTQRALADVRRADEVARRSAAAEHRRALADVDERAASAERARRERARDAVEAEEVAALYRRASRSGARARLRTRIQGSAEMRALRIARVRSVTLWAGFPILVAFAAWSTTGVQAGVVRLLALPSQSAGWYAAWGMEPALMAIVALIIIGRAVLRSAGGNTDTRATIIERVALLTSIALNIAGGWNPALGFWSAAAAAVAHSVGPVGAAGTAYLIGLFDHYATVARPWENAPSLDSMGLAGTRPDDVRTPINLDKPDSASMDDRLVEEVRQTIGCGRLTPDPTGYAIYKHVMGGRGDKSRAYRAALAVAGWRPAPADRTHRPASLKHPLPTAPVNGTPVPELAARI